MYFASLCWLRGSLVVDFLGVHETLPRSYQPRSKKMNKLYYTCPLQAAYMNKEFGVKFYTIWGRLDTTHEAQLLKFCRIKSLLELRCDLFLVQDDSLSIFEPQDGDALMVYWRDFFGEECSDLTNYFHKPEPDWDGFTIIQRDNKPFFVPEKES